MALKGVHTQILIVIPQNNYIENGIFECFQSIFMGYNYIMPRLRGNYLCEETRAGIEIASLCAF